MRTPRTSRAQTGRSTAAGPAEVSFLEDLAALLAGDQSVYFRFGPEGAIMSVKSSERTFAIGDVIDAGWRDMTPDERAQAVLAWIRKAAKYCRKPRVRWDSSSSRSGYGA